MKKLILFTNILFLCSFVFSQNENSKWFFSLHAGLDFLTTPPTLLTNGATVGGRSFSSASDEAGNLLFYTDGGTIWNKQHTVMSNGNGIINNPLQYAALIAKQPGNSNIYYMFSCSWSQSPGFIYSIIDMSLAAGMGSVTAKAIPIQTPSSQKICGVTHCNGSDIWILSHDFNSNNFRANLLTATGLNTTAVISSAGITYTSNYNTSGQMKFSPNGKKLGVATYFFNSGTFEIFDFDRSTGVVSNPLNLGMNFPSTEGCEFSSDGTKFYGSGISVDFLYQWDLCAGSNSAIIASQYTLTNSNSISFMQRAIDGKIYLANSTSPTSLAVINNPNNAGTSCNFVPNGLSLGTYSSGGLPNFVNKPFQTPFTYTNSFSCNTVSFTSSYAPTLAVCPGVSDPITALEWFFDDPLSGTANTSTLIAPVHQYPASGTYKVKLAIHGGSCVADTLIQIVTIPLLPPLNTSGNYTICPGASATITAGGANSYSWSNGTTASNSIVVNPSVTTIYTVTGTYSNTSCASTQTVSVVPATCLGLSNINSESLVKLYPNPFQNKLNIELNRSSIITIYNQIGMNVAKFHLESGSHELDTEKFVQGVYFMNVETDEQRLNIKLIRTD